MRIALVTLLPPAPRALIADSHDPGANAPGFMLTPASQAGYLRTMTLTLPTLLLLSYERNDIVCSPGPIIAKSTENRSR
jgi:hypothetical protein